VRTTPGYWLFLVEEKHPVLAGRERDIIAALADPHEVRQSRKDSDVYLFYRRDAERWLCAVTRCAEPAGFLITAYPTDAIKTGALAWTRSR